MSETESNGLSQARGTPGFPRDTRLMPSHGAEPALHMRAAISRCEADARSTTKAGKRAGFERMNVKNL